MIRMEPEAQRIRLPRLYEPAPPFTAVTTHNLSLVDFEGRWLLEVAGQSRLEQVRPVGR